jgi:SAM-dependent methyltransferase
VADAMLVDELCPACGRCGLDVFYQQRDVPAHSTLLLPTRREALDYPRGSIRLAFCPACGFITNLDFDVALNEYSMRIEETQGFSPHFKAWLRELAQQYVDRYNLRGRKVLEIGCGKGEFLSLLCEVGGNDGIGIDPSYVEGRFDLPAADRMTFINELYSEDFGYLVGDAVICRHTLEHIGPVADFVGIIARSLSGRNDVLVFFELPETLRILRAQVFWDIYYEHCSYFTPGSLARLFRSQGLQPVDLRLDYADQYVLIDSRPGGVPTPSLPLEDDLATTAALVAEFRTAVPARIAELRALVVDAASTGKRVMVWGGGSKGVSFLTTLGLHDEVDVVVDVDPNKQGMFMASTGHEIVGPSDLPDRPPDLVIVMNPIYRDEIAADLARRDLAPELVTID